MTPEQALQAERMVEAVLFAAPEPVPLEALRTRLPEWADAEAALAALSARHEGRGVELVQVAGGWTFRTAPDLSGVLSQGRDAPRRLSKAALETLAIIAYHQPVTRAEIERVRGVALSRGTLDLLLELGLVRLRGRRRTPGRPLTLGTTPAFLERFGLTALTDLPGAADLRASGLLAMDLPDGFVLPTPEAGAPDEDPLDPEDTPEFYQDALEPG